MKWLGSLFLARIRSIKPEFWTSEQVAECSPNARLVFIGMWSFCDDSGIHPASTKRLKMEVFPADNFTDAQVKALVDELIGASLIQPYEVSGQQFWRVTGWKHQKIDKPSFKYPLPNGSTPSSWKVAERSPNASGVIKEHSPADVDVDVDVESIGVEGSRVDGQVHEIAALYPKIKDAFHLPRDTAECIAAAIARDGRDVVWVGTKSVNEAVGRWPVTERQFLPSPQKFFRESLYRNDAAEWERGANGNGKKPNKLSYEERVAEEFRIARERGSIRSNSAIAK